MISIIVPVYKAEATIRKCIESILSQTYTDWELILVDDGSPDNSGKICDEYAKIDKRITVLHQANRGVSTARNVGITEANGDYISFVDSDDYLMPTFLSRFDLACNAEIQVVGITNIFKDGQTSILQPPNTELMSIIDTLSVSENLQYFMSPWAKLFKASVIIDNDLSFPTDICYTEDEIFVKKCLFYTNNIRMIACTDYQYTHFNENSLASKHYTSDELKKCLDIDAMEYRNLKAKFGVLPDAYVRFCTRRKSYLFHRIASTIMYEGGDKAKLNRLCLNYNYLLAYKGDLPMKYLIERFCLKYLPTALAIVVLRLVFNKEKNI